MDGPQYGKVPLGRVRWSVFGGGACVCALVGFLCSELSRSIPSHRALALISVFAGSVRAAF